MSTSRIAALLLGLGLALAGCEGEDGGDAADARVEETAADAENMAADVGIADMDDEVDAAVEADAADGDPVPDAGEPLDAAPAAQLNATEPYERAVEFGWIAAGQPTEARVREIVAAGVPIISLRYPQEDPFDEAALVAELGGRFERYATSGADYDSVAFRDAMYDLYDGYIEAGGTVYLHCASSNRVGASWALYHGERLGLGVDEAIAVGQAAGLSGLVGRVRAILEAGR